MTTRIFIIAHEPLASAMRQCAGHVFPDKMQAILALDVKPGDSPEESLRQAHAKARAQAGKSGHAPLLLVTDMLGATPCNVAQQLAIELQARVVTGANMPMLLRALTYQDESLDVLVEKILEGGARGVVELKQTEGEK